MSAPAPGDRLAAISWPLRTSRALIRRAEPADARAVWEIRREPKVAQGLPFEAGTVADFSTQWRGADSLSRYLVVEQAGVLVGDLMCTLIKGFEDDEGNEVDALEAVLGWVIAPQQQGSGLATETVGELITQCRKVLQVRRFSAISYADNAASRRVMEKLGLRQVSRFFGDGRISVGYRLDVE